ncbi:TlyA family rRNA (cytidine-2'-O)-methyltransferase [Gordonia amarae]|uniref:Hemolysin n=2 Tax=Gordonia amarae TaxID=36821 RepID=G7GKN5_9ACTN|nr:TlyA family RNA methyltransferase [Gordonia amarae]MCS3879397.1 23S rRNA (cytidine1920-2'-O)/16S rRNA (cytidine1409-2'-O)-methyltransferase [Gordonia amarae]QHN17876.1 TlyA family rRNA (cytidine-2'-O)-methyltransferase [Gordonia amarae]QHN22398.1 TlyA family rRNA (cytidine-2'-O)-methyltransferase [Gordonia amarae]QHN31274.1 TlyA family rRNA (cytidine-2'-O)-methyltransferase [Gordonia amarae]QHN40019.1 TlyA family rRNA (cytidine-2'-O)-methyltransferase [Gordonia amarae]
MAARARLDAELVRRGLARSREQAREFIEAGTVKVNGVVAAKPATNVARDTPIVVVDAPSDDWASRGAHKLVGALDAFADSGLTVAGRRCLDAGASTGGFTDVLLRRDARQVVAVDVGYGQLIWRLQNDERVDVHDRTNVRSLSPDQIGGRVDLVVADLSFISLSLVLAALADCVEPGGDLLPMVKPQFQVGKDRVGAGGVVRDPALRIEAVAEVAGDAAALGLETRGVVASPLPGPAGNVEYFIWLHKPETRPSEPADSESTRSTYMSSATDKVDDRSAPVSALPVEPEIMAMITAAVEAGPR